MRPQLIYNAFAVILPVALGLGLVHLSSTGRLDATLAVAFALGIAFVMGAAVMAREALERRELGEGEDPP
jgi:hypothetical protein